MFSKFCYLRILVFDPSFPVHPVSESRGCTVSVTNKGGRTNEWTEILVSIIWCTAFSNCSDGWQCCPIVEQCITNCPTIQQICGQLPNGWTNIYESKAIAIRADLMDFDFNFDENFRFGDISVLVTFPILWHFRFGVISVLVTFLHLHLHFCIAFQYWWHFSFWKISTLMTFQFWGHFSFGVISVLMIF